MNLKKQASKKDKTYAEVLEHHDGVIRSYETRLLNVRTELTEKIVRRNTEIIKLKEEMSESKALVAELTEVGLRRSVRLRELKLEIACRDAYIAQLKATIAELEEKLTHMRPLPRCRVCGGEGHNIATCRR